MLLNLEKYIDLFSKIAYNLDHSPVFDSYRKIKSL